MFCASYCGVIEFGWDFQPAINTAGGLLCIWNEQTFKVDQRVRGGGFILLQRTCIQENQKAYIANIYSPCDSHNKRELWDSLKQLRYQDPQGQCCFLGDFNSIRHHSERVGVSQRGVEASSINDFNEWIADLDFVETPNVGRSFTWFKPNGAAKSKLDRILVSHQWLHKWPDSTSFTLDRNFSDHCPILLRAKITD